MTQRASTLLLAFGFAAFAVATLWIALRLPVFHHSDELAHFDVALKRARGLAPAPADPIEPDLAAFALATLGISHPVYFGAPATADARDAIRQLTSYEAYQPPLFYLLAAALLRVAANAGFERQVQSVRLLEATLVLLGRGLVLLALIRLGLPLAVAAAPYLFLVVPVDLLRVSNDALVYALGSFALWLLVARCGGSGLAPRHAALLGAALALALLAKLSALLFLVPAAALALFFLRRELRLAPGRLALVFAPVLAAAAWLALRGHLAGHGLAGVAHLADGHYPAPTGFRPLELFPSIEKWVYWQMMFLAPETLLAGRKFYEVYPLGPLATLVVLGHVAAFAALLPGLLRDRARAAFAWSAERLDALRRVALSGAAAMLALLTIASALIMLVGKAFFWSSRLVLPVELLVVAPPAIGWALALAGPTRGLRVARAALWLAAVGLCASATWPYLRG